jgi:hypothetical protein
MVSGVAAGGLESLGDGSGSVMRVCGSCGRLNLAPISHGSAVATVPHFTDRTQGTSWCSVAFGPRRVEEWAERPMAGCPIVCEGGRRTDTPTGRVTVFLWREGNPSGGGVWSAFRWGRVGGCAGGSRSRLSRLRRR